MKQEFRWSLQDTNPGGTCVDACTHWSGGCNCGVFCGVLECIQASVCVCVCVWVHVHMRLFVAANSLIPGHVPETCNRCLQGKFAHTHRRKHIALQSLLLILCSLRLLWLVMLEHESNRHRVWRTNKGLFALVSLYAILQCSWRIQSFWFGLIESLGRLTDYTQWFYKQSCWCLTTSWSLSATALQRFTVVAITDTL